jgi:hypothetical protein
MIRSRWLEADAMLRRDGRYVCEQCGAALDIPLDAKPQLMFVQEADGPRIRLLMIDADEIHRCWIDG